MMVLNCSYCYTANIYTAINILVELTASEAPKESPAHENFNRPRTWLVYS